jgi:glycosyltransferase involved in cell wall biosynthesis
VTGTPLTYAVVTPTRDEAANLARLANALVEQEHRPACWMIVVDASSDGTLERAQSLADDHSWIRVLDIGTPAAGAIANGRREGRPLENFRAGVRALPEPTDVVVKQDADTSFVPDYFRELIGRFAAEPKLGIAGGACYEEEDGRWVRRKVSPTHPRGASRAYRFDCLDTVMGLEPRMGWDGLDEVRAHLAGYATRTVVELPFFHHRVTGGRERSVLRHGAAQGRAAWYMGYRPTYVFLRALYRLPTERSAPGIVWGYAAAAARRERRCPDPHAVRAIREQQRVRRALLRGTPP